MYKEIILEYEEALYLLDWDEVIQSMVSYRWLYASHPALFVATSKSPTSCNSSVQLGMVSWLERVKLLHGIERTCGPVKNMSNEHLLATTVVHEKEYIFHIKAKQSIYHLYSKMQNSHHHGPYFQLIHTRKLLPHFTFFTLRVGHV